MGAGSFCLGGQPAFQGASRCPPPCGYEGEPHTPPLLLSPVLGAGGAGHHCPPERHRPEKCGPRFAILAQMQESRERGVALLDSNSHSSEPFRPPP